MDRLSTLEITAPLPYPCPHCWVELEVRDDDHDEWLGWRRCPACDRPLLPPPRVNPALAPWQTAGPTREEILRVAEAESLLVIGPSPEDRPPPLWTPQQFEPFGRARQSQSAAWLRRGLSIGFALSLFAVLVAFLGQSNLALGVFSLISLVFFLLLSRPVRTD